MSYKYNRTQKHFSMNYCKCALWKEGLLEHGMVIVRVHMMEL